MIPAACCVASSGTSISAGVRLKMNRRHGERVKHGTEKNPFRGLLAAALVAMGMLMFASPATAEVKLLLDRNRITEGETVTLTFMTDDAKQSLEADFSALERDFVILDRRSETQLSIVNGRQTAVVRLLLTVEPRRAGELTIPAIDFGNEQTRPLVLRVDEAPELAPGEMPPVFVEVEVTPEQGPYYVHAQLGLIVRVFYQQNLTEAAISQPEPSQASVRLLQETPYQADRGGERYRVLERRYAIFPERSGELTLPAMQLSGRLVERRDSSIWQPSVRGRRVTVESEALRLQIDPRPPEFTGPDWQPARSFNLSQQVSSTDALRVGEPVTRTIIIDAAGLEENMIAEPAWPELPGARIYPDQPQGISRDDGEWVLGHKEFRYAVVPEKEGELVLPELAVHWWDTANDREQIVVLPAQTLTVLPSALVPSVPDSIVPAVPGAAPTGMSGLGEATGVAGWWRLSTLLFAGLWLLTLVFYWRSRGREAASVGVGRGDRDAVAGEDELLDGLRRACERGDLAGVRRDLSSWLREFGPATAGGSLLDFAAREADAALSESIYALDSQGFRDGATQDRAMPGLSAWSGREFWERFENWRRAWRAKERQERPALTDLYAPENRQR
jgi:hypothetical protein